MTPGAARFVAWSLIVCLTVGLVGCGGASREPRPPQPLLGVLLGFVTGKLGEANGKVNTGLAKKLGLPRSDAWADGLFGYGMSYVYDWLGVGDEPGPGTPTVDLEPVLARLGEIIRTLDAIEKHIAGVEAQLEVLWSQLGCTAAKAERDRLAIKISEELGTVEDRFDDMLQDYIAAEPLPPREEAEEFARKILAEPGYMSPDYDVRSRLDKAHDYIVGKTTPSSYLRALTGQIIKCEAADLRVRYAVLETEFLRLISMQTDGLVLYMEAYNLLHEEAAALDRLAAVSPKQYMERDFRPNIEAQVDVFIYCVEWMVASQCQVDDPHAGGNDFLPEGADEVWGWADVVAARTCEAITPPTEPLRHPFGIVCHVIGEPAGVGTPWSTPEERHTPHLLSDPSDPAYLGVPFDLAPLAGLREVSGLQGQVEVRSFDTPAYGEWERSTTEGSVEFHFSWPERSGQVDAEWPLPAGSLLGPQKATAISVARYSAALPNTAGPGQEVRVRIPWEAAVEGRLTTTDPKSGTPSPPRASMTCPVRHAGPELANGLVWHAFQTLQDGGSVHSGTDGWVIERDIDLRGGLRGQSSAVQGCGAVLTPTSGLDFELELRGTWTVDHYWRALGGYCGRIEVLGNASQRLWRTPVLGPSDAPGSLEVRGTIKSDCIHRVPYRFGDHRLLGLDLQATADFRGWCIGTPMSGHHTLRIDSLGVLIEDGAAPAVAMRD